MIEAVIDPFYEAWQERARAFLASRTPPDAIFWAVRGEQGLLPIAGDAPPDAPSKSVRVPRRFVDLARHAACHRAADRWTVMYRVLWRLAYENRRCLDDPLDGDVTRLTWLVQQVRQDVHRMQAFVRFRRVEDEGIERLVAWYVPDHDIAALAAPHFAERYKELRWSILTPQRSVHWAGGVLTVGEGVPATAHPRGEPEEAAETLWRTYYSAVFNPARLNERKLLRDMPVKFRAALPEAAEIPRLVAAAPALVEDMRSRSGGTTRRIDVPAGLDMASLRQAAACCRSCPLHEPATQVVFGQGPAPAPMMLVGEQPGDAEDLSGSPFVGPAGDVLHRALAEAGIDRAGVYLTNAVKHFGWEPRGKRRIHRTPRLSEIQACRPWLESEIAAVSPRVLLLLGGTAARALLGPQARVTELRGTALATRWAPFVIVTYHPSAVLRAGGSDAEAQTFALLVSDLRLAARQLAPEAATAR